MRGTGFGCYIPAMFFKRFCMMFVGCLVAGVAGGQTPGVAPTPPMGWNSWDSYGLTITEPQFRANVQVQKEKLLPFGWQYAVVDEGWFFENPLDRETPDKLHYAIDSHGRYVPVPARFPSAGKEGAGVLSAAVDGRTMVATVEETSFVDLGRFVHAQGLKFGIHIVRGIPRASVERNLPIAGSSFKAQDAADKTDVCPWDPTNWGVKDTPAGQAWYDSLLAQYAGWGVDLLKVDCISDHPYKVDEIRMIRKAIDKTGRPMVLSLSPGPTNLSHAEEVSSLATMWRISDDIWDTWQKPDKKFPQTVKSQFARFAAWEKYAKPGDWPDGDMLPLGELRPEPGWGKGRTSALTPDEQRTQLALWAIARSPLIVGANLTLLDAKTLAMLTNRELIAIDQTSTGSAEVLHEGDLIVWRSKLADGVAIAVFNTGDVAMQVDRKFEDLGAGAGERAVHDVWSGKELGRRSGMSMELAPHACALWRVR
jgi:alpha-galactosidase